MHHARDHNILYKLQHRFQDWSSCETQLLGFQDDILRSMAEGKQADVIILDFSQAFDKVSHRKLVAKMEFYGVWGRTNTWIQNFLADRSQIVLLEGAQSYQATVKSGVPQESILGPSLFLFYINDMPDTLRSEDRLFADGTIVYISVAQKQDASIFQQDLEKLAKWEKKEMTGLDVHKEMCTSIFWIQTAWTHLGKCEGRKVCGGYVLRVAKYVGVMFWGSQSMWGLCSKTTCVLQIT